MYQIQKVKLFRNFLKFIKERILILRYYLKQINHKLSEEEIENVNDNMNGFTGADIFSSLRKAILKGLKNVNI